MDNNMNISERCKILQNLLKDKKYADMLSFLSQYKNYSLDELYYKVLAKFYLKQYNDMVDDVAYVLREKGIGYSFLLCNIARTVSQSLNFSGKIALDFWEKCSNEKMLLAFEIAEQLKHNDFTDIFSKFASLCTLLNFDNGVKNNYETAFQYLVETIQGKIPDKQISIKTKKTIFVCGTGWSGSSAVADCLKEFSNVYCIPFELRQITGYLGWKNLLNNYAKREKYLQSVIDFFFVNILGCYKLRGNWDYKMLFSVDKTIKYINNNLQYSERALECVITICQSFAMYDNNMSNAIIYVKNILKQIVNLLSCTAPDDSLILFDSVVTAQDIYFAKYFDNAIFLCVFRDARSQYTSIDFEYLGGFPESIDYYIKEYQNRRLHEFTTTYQTLIANKNFTNKILAVRFDEFVLSKSFRNDLISRLGLLKENHRDKLKYFDPNKSIHNVFLYLKQTKQNLIKSIELSIPFFCFDHIQYEYNHNTLQQIIDLVTHQEEYNKIITKMNEMKNDMTILKNEDMINNNQIAHFENIILCKDFAYNRFRYEKFKANCQYTIKISDISTYPYTELVTIGLYQNNNYTFLYLDNHNIHSNEYILNFILGKDIQDIESIHFYIYCGLITYTNNITLYIKNLDIYEKQLEN